MKRHNPLPLLLDIIVSVADAIRTTILAHRVERELRQVLEDCAPYLESSMARPTPPPADEKWIDAIEKRITG